MKTNYEEVVVEVIKDLEARYTYDEDALRAACRQCLPSFKQTKDTEYGLYNRRGYQTCRFEIYDKAGHRYSVSCWHYDSYYDVA